MDEAIAFLDKHYGKGLVLVALVIVSMSRFFPPVFREWLQHRRWITNQFIHDNERLREDKLKLKRDRDSLIARLQELETDRSVLERKLMKALEERDKARL